MLSCYRKKSNCYLVQWSPQNLRPSAQCINTAAFGNEGYSVDCSMWVTVAIVVVLLCLIWALTGRAKGLPAGPTCFPIIGNIGLFRPSEATQAHRKFRKIYGDFYSLMIFNRPVIFISGFDNIRQLLVKHGDMFSERPRVYPSEVIAKRKGTNFQWNCMHIFCIMFIFKILYLI